MIINNVNPLKILDEFINNGITWIKATNDMKYNNSGNPLTDTCNLTVEFVDGTDVTFVQQIIDAHDPTPIPPEPTDKERIEQLENMILMMMEVM